MEYIENNNLGYPAQPSHPANSGAGICESSLEIE
jgi:hypothetical protein